MTRAREIVAHYPRPPRLEPSARRIRVLLAGVWIVDSVRAWRVLETHHPPTWYIPRADVLPGCLEPASGRSFCEFKGVATYWDVVAGGRRACRAAWSYESPPAAYSALQGHLAFYAGRMDACYVDEEQVEPQPGDFYGGWITSDVAGPFKGGPGTSGW